MKHRKNLRILVFTALLFALILTPTVSQNVTAKAAVKLSKTVKNLYEGDSYKLKLKGTKKKVKFSSSNKLVATVTKKGVVKAQGAGTATITATCNKKKYTCSVVVRKSDTSKSSLKGLLALDLDGNTIDISTFADYNITMINVWEPWCGPCLRELPDIEKLYERYKGNGLNVIGVAGEDQEWVASTAKQNGLTYSIINNYMLSYNLNNTGSIPCTLFVDKNGYIIGEPYVGSRSFDSWYSIVSPYLDK